MANTVFKHVFGWMAPPVHNSREVSRASVAERTTTYQEPDTCVRGRTAARDACQRAAMSGSTGIASTAGSIEASGAATSGKMLLGYKTNMQSTYAVLSEVGRGANGVVSKVQHIPSGKIFACKSIPKKPSADMSREKQAAHLQSVQEEISVMKELTSCLNVAKLEDVFEDDARVHIMQELCTGGELAHSIGQRHYSERTVASYMRAVLKTLAQCHAHNILHRDIKPGNFLLASEEDDARVKAIDFGLAVMYKPGDDLTNLDMQGTPWFLAPEALSSRWSPASDVWAAGVMAFQLLTGRLPFNDKRNPHNPALSAVLRSILTDKLDFNRSYWQDISSEGKDFVKALLTRDASKRPSAQDALNHPWLVGDVADRKKGTPLSLNVVQRIQRFGRNNALKRSLLELMVAELADDDMAGEGMVQVDAKGRPLMDSPNAHAVHLVLRYLDLNTRTFVDRQTVAEGLAKMGYRLHAGELERLMLAISAHSDSISRATVVASLIDWRYLQQHQKARWLALAQRAFDNIDVDQDGAVSVDEMIRALQANIPEDEVQRLYQDVVASMPAYSRARAMSFQSFLQFLRQPSGDSLDLYDDRLEGSMSTLRSFGSSHGTKVAYSPGSSDSVRTLAGACAVEARRDGAIGTSLDCSTHRGRELSTVFEQRRR